MKLILGDNQFFGVNHHDLKKAAEVKKIFYDEKTIESFIKESLILGIDGFMINSNVLGFNVIKNYIKLNNEEIHYSIPYPHKYANMVNESGLISLLFHFLSNTTLKNILKCLPKFILTKNLKYLLPIATDLEIPKNLPEGSFVYLQNILTDLILGIGRYDLLEYFVQDIKSKGFKPGLITLNPIRLDKVITKSNVLNTKDLVCCFNINYDGFNVFPNRKKIEDFIKKDKNYLLMGMSILSSGGGGISKSLDYAKTLDLDYIVFGSSKIKNIQSNYNHFKS